MSTPQGTSLPPTARASAEAVAAAAERLSIAAATSAPCAPVRDLIGTDDAAAAYAVQERIVADRLAAGASVVGRKIGLTSPAVQQQLGVDQPDFGVLFDDMRCAEAVPIPLSRLLQPKVEAEIAFVLDHDLVDGPLDDAQIRGAVDYAVAALEIVDSRITGWDITFGDTVADNGSSGLFVLGADRRTLDSFDPVAAQMQMLIDDTEVSTGTGAACLGDPLRALAWLARTAREFGQPLLSGQVILSGALGPMAVIDTAGTVRADITGLGSVTATFTQE
ncbi:2-keto-4-pentenoate hydratase [Rhodococcus oxybenzonivorans]|uniref:2-keto-4-pentenoate hydratase n=1 Tax=Rhodococcus oxybenzonivorans TaxID=1990687 RepID=A0A2S2C3R8_9NOCA|nr:fumarylacetoacetate hydrolase family protein [Rhodococcus oxybenzonivorans]AWK75546.1 2-keto-4-pentenoate hydratase [Rhodococcus oxybenzonivorans]